MLRFYEKFRICSKLQFSGKLKNSIKPSVIPWVKRCLLFKCWRDTLQNIEWKYYFDLFKNILKI